MKRSMSFLFGIILIFSGLSQSEARVSFKNLPQILGQMNLSPIYGACGNQTYQPRIAVLENSFYGAEEEIGKGLPADTEILVNPVAGESKSPHGYYVAQMITDVMTNFNKCPGLAPKLFLIPASGYTPFTKAIGLAIDKNVDVIVFANVLEYGGNGDGHGFINKEVSRATDKGIIWVNAAGNFQDSTYYTNVKVGQDDWLSLPGNEPYIGIRCLKTKYNDKCILRSVLTWNAYTDDVNQGTDKNLDLAITDDMGRILEASARIQTAEDTSRLNPLEYSKYPLEIVEKEVEPGLYYAKIKARSKNWSEKDVFRLLVSGDFLQLTTPSPSNKETLLPPADHPDVITVGANDSEKSSVSVVLRKPDFILPSLIETDKNETFKGSSISAAIYGGLVGLTKSFQPNWKKNKIESVLQNEVLNVVWNPIQINTNASDIPNNNTCVPPVCGITR